MKKAKGTNGVPSSRPRNTYGSCRRRRERKRKLILRKKKKEKNLRKKKKFLKSEEGNGHLNSRSSKDSNEDEPKKLMPRHIVKLSKVKD